MKIATHAQHVLPEINAAGGTSLPTALIFSYP